jgi:hypothetical protein
MPERWTWVLERVAVPDPAADVQLRRGAGKNARVLDHGLLHRGQVPAHWLIGLIDVPSGLLR